MPTSSSLIVELRLVPSTGAPGGRRANRCRMLSCGLSGLHGGLLTGLALLHLQAGTVCQLVRRGCASQMRHVTWGLARAKRHLANALSYQTSERVDLKAGLTSPLGDRARTRNRIVHSCLAKRNRDRSTVVLVLPFNSLASGTTLAGGTALRLPRIQDPPARGLHTRTSIVEPITPPIAAGTLVSVADSSSCLIYYCELTVTSRHLETGWEKKFLSSPDAWLGYPPHVTRVLGPR